MPRPEYKTREKLQAQLRDTNITSEKRLKLEAKLADINLKLSEARKAAKAKRTNPIAPSTGLTSALPNTQSYKITDSMQKRINPGVEILWKALVEKGRFTGDYDEFVRITFGR